MNKILFLLQAACCACLVSALDVTVLDADLEMPLEGVTVAFPGGKTVTDAEGKASVALPPGRHRLNFSLPGYDNLSAYAASADAALSVSLRIASVLEGQELVVERAAPLKSDTQSGISVAITEREMEATAEIGIVEDVMSAIKTLPGVGYAGGWNAMPSIRGGSPLETTVVMDGFEVSYPYHWGGAFSIFNPNMVESAKLSAGLVSARYGRLISGLLEINTKTPDVPSLRVETSLTTSGAEAFVQAPLGENAGVLLGGKATWMEVSFALAGASNEFEQVPYIRDGYGKVYWKPSNRLTLYANGFLGTDGVGVAMDSEGETVSTEGEFEWMNLTAILSGGIKWLPADDLHVQASGGWSRHVDRPVFDSTYGGDLPYSDEFLDKYDGSALDGDGAVDGLIDGEDSFDISGTYFTYRGKQVTDIFQGREENQWEFARGQSFAAGADLFLQSISFLEDAEGYSDYAEGGVDYYIPVAFKAETDANKHLSSGAFFLWEFASANDRLDGEAGIRVDHAYLWNDEVSIQTYPVANPRLRLTWKPAADAGSLRSLSFTAGGGLFSKLPYLSGIFEKEYGIDDYEFSPDRAVFGLVGTEANFAGGWKFSLETYGKYYFSRVYLTQVPETNPIEVRINKDGLGAVGGFDLMLQKKESRWFDGYLTYSFVYARYYNPQDPVEGSETALMDGGPLGRWYFPPYHRFHNLNLVANFKPWSGVVFTVKGSLASGTPRDKVGEAEPYAAIMDDGTVIERWRRDAEYSDVLRTDLSCPVDVKLAFSGYYPRSKVRWEYYIGVENVFAALYSPKTNKAIDEFTGDELSGSGEAEFTAGVPIPSFGFKLSY